MSHPQYLVKKCVTESTSQTECDASESECLTRLWVIQVHIF